MLKNAPPGRISLSMALWTSIHRNLASAAACPFGSLFRFRRGSALDVVGELPEYRLRILRGQVHVPRDDAGLPAADRTELLLSGAGLREPCRHRVPQVVKAEILDAGSIHGDAEGR